MPFRTSTAGLHRRFDLVRRSLLQAPGLPFADTLSAEQIQRAFDTEGVRFGDDDDEVVYTPAVTLWAMLSQMLFRRTVGANLPASVCSARPDDGTIAVN
jgi:hypothetical protein